MEDEAMLATVEAAFGDYREATRWGVTEDLLAFLAEMVHALMVVTVKANTPAKDQHKLSSLKPLHIPRPWESDEEKSAVPAVSMGAMARRLAGG